MITRSMRRAILAFVLGVGVSTASGRVHAEEPIVVLPEQIEWRALGSTGAEMAVLYGDPSEAAPYTMIVRVPAGTKIPPHSHPDRWRNNVVLSGTLYFAFGDTWDDAELRPFPPGTFWTEPPGSNHYAWAKDGDVIAMSTAMGPSGRTPATPAQ